VLLGVDALKDVVLEAIGKAGAGYQAEGKMLCECGACREGCEDNPDPESIAYHLLEQMRRWSEPFHSIVR
jgi:hypothetical protein